MLVVDSIWKESGMCGKEILTIKILSLPSSYVDAKVLHWKVIILRVVLLLSIKLLKRVHLMLVVDSIWKESGMCGKEILTIKILSLPSSYVDTKVLHCKVIILRVVLLLSIKLLKRVHVIVVVDSI